MLRLFSFFVIAGLLDRLPKRCSFPPFIHGYWFPLHLLDVPACGNVLKRKVISLSHCPWLFVAALECYVSMPLNNIAKEVPIKSKCLRCIGWCGRPLIDSAHMNGSKPLPPISKYGSQSYHPEIPECEMFYYDI